MGELSKLKGLGPKSEAWLNEIGIYSRNELEQTGAVQAFIKLEQGCSVKPSLNFLYAMAGALENVHWTQIVKSEKSRLLLELESYRELEAIFKSENDKA